MTDTAKSLRDWADDIEWPGGARTTHWPQAPKRKLREVADEIERVRRERDAQYDVSVGYIREITAVEAENKTLERQHQVDLKIHSEYVASLTSAEAEIEQLHRIGRALIYHDERGQGQGWREAMKELYEALPPLIFTAHDKAEPGAKEKA